MKKAIEIVTLARVEGANLNSNGTEGVISILKKARDPVDQKEYVRVSGQSYKYNLRELIAEIAGTDKISQRVKEVEKEDEKGRTTKTVVTSLGNPVRFYDDDLFGFMIAADRKRIAPVRTSGLISIFPYQEDRDFGVAYNPDPKTKEHNIFETEISTNIMRGNVFIELDRVGVFDKAELEGLKDSEKKDRLSDEERTDRVRTLLRAVMDYHGGAHLSRHFTKVYPEAIVAVLLNRKIPVIGDAFRVKQGYVDGKVVVDTEALKERYTVFEEYIESMYIGCFTSTVANLDELKKTFDGTRCEVLPMLDFRKKMLEIQVM